MKELTLKNGQGASILEGQGMRPQHRVEGQTVLFPTAEVVLGMSCTCGSECTGEEVKALR